MAPPRNGSYELRILSPALLELEWIQAKPVDPAPLPAWNIVGDNRQSILLGAEAFTVEAGDAPVPVQAMGFKRRAAYAPLAQRDLRVASFVYLKLAQPIPDGATVRVASGDSTLLPTGAPLVATANAMRTNPAIHVNQIGYLPGGPKKAMVGHYLGTLGEMDIPASPASRGFVILDESGAEVFDGPLVARPDQGWVYSPAPYQKVFEADFSAFVRPGTYRLQVPTLGTSLPFRIDEGVPMSFARTYALGLYHQRCGTTNALPFTRFVHDACHTAPASVPSPESGFAFTWKIIGEKSADFAANPRHTATQLRNEASQLYPFVHQGTQDVSGGHHDAGDYSKYTTNSASLVHHLVFAVDALPGVATLDNLGLPESGDSIPDLLQEAKWEADYLAKLQDDDGGFYFLVYPRNRAYENNVLPDRGDPQVVWPKNTAATAAAVAALAQCASSPRFRQHYPEAAALYLEKARRGWRFLTDAIAARGRDGAYQKLTHYGDNFMHDDELAWAAVEMFLATGEAAIHDVARSWFKPATPETRRWGWWRLSEAYGNATRSYGFAARTARVAADRLDAIVLARCEAEMVAAGDDTLKWSRQSAYGTSFPEETKRARGGGWYFSLDQAFDLVVALQLDPPPLSGLREKYLDAFTANLNYEAGSNPVNISYVTGLGQRRQREIVHQYAQNDRRALPPSGLPQGNIQAGQPYLDLYRAELGAMSFPDDGAASAPYSYYDRWSDTFNVSAEFVVVNQARALAGLAFMAAQTSLRSQPWRSAEAGITVTNPASGTPGPTATVSLTTPSGLNPADAIIVWEARGQEPIAGGTVALPATSGVPEWIEAEALWPDGRRVFAVTSASPPGNSLPVITMTVQNPNVTIDRTNPVVLEFRRTGDLTAPLMVRFTLSGTATKWNDYRRPEGDMPESVTFPAGIDKVTLSIIPAPGFNALLGAKTVTLSLAAGTGYSAGESRTATFTLGSGAPPPPPPNSGPPTPPPPPPPTPPAMPSDPAAPIPSKLTNFSARSIVAATNRTLVVGFTIVGSPNTLLIRGIGPGLAAFGLTETLGAPQLRVFDGQGIVAHGNDSAIGSNAAAVAAATSRVRAFALPDGTKDTALLRTLPRGGYTAQLTAADQFPGHAMVELYDCEPSDGTSFSNLSTLAEVDAGDGALISGFVVGGETTKTMLIRGVGPTLARFGVAKPLRRLRLRVFAGPKLLTENHAWGRAPDPAAVEALATKLGAFALPVASEDAAVLVTLRPGVYAVHVSNLDPNPGMALIEIYADQDS